MTASCVCVLPEEDDNVGIVNQTFAKPTPLHHCLLANNSSLSRSLSLLCVRVHIGGNMPRATLWQRTALTTAVSASIAASMNLYSW
jgi:hypothetical protein